jgi:hypothetical protein
MYSNIDDEGQAGQVRRTSTPRGHRRESSTLSEEADMFAPPALSIHVRAVPQSIPASRQPSLTINSPTSEGSELMPKQRASCLAQVRFVNFENTVA